MSEQLRLKQRINLCLIRTRLFHPQHQGYQLLLWLLAPKRFLDLIDKGRF